MENNENKNICASCNGVCCKTHPCQLFPQDLKEITVEKIVELLNGNYCLDFWEGEYDFGYWIQPKVKNDNRYVQPIWHGECIFFEDAKGCQLTFENRPTQGKALVPNESNCTLPEEYNKIACRDAWKPYHHILKKALELVKMKEVG